MISFDEFSVAVSCDLLLEMLLWSHPIYRALAHLLGGSDEAYLQMSESTIKEQIRKTAPLIAAIVKNNLCGILCCKARGSRTTEAGDDKFAFVLHGA
jgi:hypothetical protein